MKLSEVEAETRIFLDDERQPYDERWTLVKNVAEFTDFIYEAKNITHISFDHDLGMDDDGYVAFDGNNAANRLVSAARRDPNRFANLQQIVIHTMNPVGAKNIEATIKSGVHHKFLPESIQIIIRPWGRSY